ncbi:hypothetical protein GCM10027589_50580 [Actinocorallia lasiicapitis]
MYQPPGSPPPPYGPPPGGGAPPPPPPFGGGGGPYYSPPPPPRRDNGPLIALLGIGGLLVVLLLGAAAVFVLTKGDDKADSPTTVLEPAAEAPGTTGFSAKYAGTWSSTVYQKRPSTASYIVTVEIASGASTGKITYANRPGEATWTCSGTLTFVKTLGSSGYKSVTRENITEKNGQDCDSFGYDVLFPKSDGTGMFITTYYTLAAAEQDTEYNAIGTLEKT